MKRLLPLILLLCLNISAYEYIDGQKLPTTVTYVCDPQLEGSLKRAFAIWNFACGGIFTLSKADLTVAQPTLTAEVDPYLAPAGQTYCYGASAAILVQMPQGLFADSIMLHELGHALGMAHTNNLQSIMNPIVVIVFASLCQDDVDGIREKYDQSPETFDFNLTVTGRRIKAISPRGPATWILNGNILFHKDRAKFSKYLPVGTHTVQMDFHGVSVYKTIQITGVVHRDRSDKK